MDKARLAHDLEAAWFSKEAGADSVLWQIFPQRSFYDLYRKMEDSGDEQSTELLREVSHKLMEALKLSDGEEHALERLNGCVLNRNSWKPDLLRNNIFKAANALGMKLPSGMFASQHQAGVRALKLHMKLKNGDDVPAGTKVDVKFRGRGNQSGHVNCELLTDWQGPSGRDYRREPIVFSIARLPIWVSGFRKPSFSQLEKWLGDGVAMTPTGKRVEPDGWGPDGSPSWLLALGMI